MDELDDQLRQLSLINCRATQTNLPSKPQKADAEHGTFNGNSSDNTISVSHTDDTNQKGSLDIRNYGVAHNARMPLGDMTKEAGSPKKVGPVVPPKPHKKNHNLPEVPQSSLIKSICEPHYSQRLQCLNSGAVDNNWDPSSLGSTSVSTKYPILQRKQSTYATQNSLGSVSSKITLDNPAILDQQLEALAYHKKQLEKRGKLLPQLDIQKGSRKADFPFSHKSVVPKLSSMSLISDLKQDCGNTTYVNVRTSSSPPYNAAANDVYSNIRSASGHMGIAGDGENEKDGTMGYNYEQQRNNIYSNIVYGKDHSGELPPPPPPAVLSISAVDTSEYLRNETIGNKDDDVPPPPSPVSSSYSELRHATDVFKSSVPMNLSHQKAAKITGYGQYESTNCSIADKLKISGCRNNYVNKKYSNEYNSYSPILQSSSTYESIYEPINPRPPSQLSSRLNYVPEGDVLGKSNSGNFSSLDIISNNPNGTNTPIYPCDIGASSNVDVLPRNIKNFNNSKEAEVEALTDFLVHSMNPVNDLESYGICFKCNQRVLGENSGCTAMDQIYHISCFKCSQCQINLQGKPFYALEGKPYCEYDYLQTLEKCSVCMKPILERILRATGKPYHPQCFTCVVCGKSLDGIPFTVDATNQNYCIADFHKKFAPRCCVCKEPIMPEPGEEETVRVVALDRSFHFECYKCEDCGLLLSSEAEGRGCYPLDDHVLCKSCNAKRVQMLTSRMTTEL